MTREQHLDKILAKLDSLIAGAKLRTPGRWQDGRTCYGIPAVFPNTNQAVCTFGTYKQFEAPHFLHNFGANATFIASCAGNAEAGWRFTVKRIESVLRRIEAGELSSAEHEMDEIIAAWPEEML